MTDIQMPDIAPLIRYLGDGTRAAFPYPFPIFETADLSVTFDGAPQYAGFAVSGAGETAGGSVTFTVAPASGVVVTLERVLALQCALHPMNAHVQRCRTGHAAGAAFALAVRLSCRGRGGRDQCRTCRSRNDREQSTRW